jgi:hypothetical protein
VGRVCRNSPGYANWIAAVHTTPGYNEIMIGMRKELRLMHAIGIGPLTYHDLAPRAVLQLGAFDE